MHSRHITLSEHRARHSRRNHAFQLTQLESTHFQHATSNRKTIRAPSPLRDARTTSNADSSVRLQRSAGTTIESSDKKLRFRLSRDPQVSNVEALSQNHEVAQRSVWTSDRHLLVLNVFAVIVHLIDGGVGMILNRDVVQTQTLIAPLFTYVTDSSTTFLQTMPRDIFTVQIFWPSIAVEFITAAFHVVYISMLACPSIDKYIQTYVAHTSSRNALRWIEYSVTASMMSAFGLVLLGDTDFYLFVKYLADGVALQFVGYATELLNYADPRDRRLFNIMWWVIGSNLNMVNVGILLYQIFASDLGSNAHVFYENVVPFAVWFNTFGIVAQLTFRKWRQFADPNFSEKYYIVLSVSTKVAVFWLGFGSYRQILENNHSIPRTGLDWAAVRYSAIAIPACVLLGYVAYDAREWRRVRVIESRLGRL